MSKELLEQIEKKIKTAQIDRKRALYDHNYEFAAALKKYIVALNEEKKHLENS